MLLILSARFQDEQQTNGSNDDSEEPANLPSVAPTDLGYYVGRHVLKGVAELDNNRVGEERLDSVLTIEEVIY